MATITLTFYDLDLCKNFYKLVRSQLSNHNFFYKYVLECKVFKYHTFSHTFSAKSRRKVNDGYYNMPQLICRVL